MSISILPALGAKPTMRQRLGSAHALLALLMIAFAGSSFAASPSVDPVSPASGVANIVQDTSIALKVFFGTLGTDPEPDGSQIEWTVQSEPALGEGSFSGGSNNSGPPAYATTTTTAGESQITLNVGSAGTYVVRARGDYCNDGCYTSYDFTINVSAEPPGLAIGTGDGQTAPPNTPFPETLTVIATGGSAPPPILTDRAGAGGNLRVIGPPGVTVTWTVVSGSATLKHTTTTTDLRGVAANRAFAGPTPGPVVVRATRDASTPLALTQTMLATPSVDFHLTVSSLPPPDPKLGDLSGLTPNQQAVADALDELCHASSSSSPSAAQQDLLERCQELIDAITTDPEGVIGALDELWADIALVQSESSLLAAQSQFENIKARIAALRSGTNRTSFGGLALNTSSGRLPIGTMLQSLLDGNATPEGQEAGADFSRWGFFASGTFGRGDANAGTLSPAYDFDIDGITVGVDYRKSVKLIFGGTLGYTRQDNDLTDRHGSLGTRGWSASLYGTWYHKDSWYVDSVLSYGRNSYDIERRIRYTITGPGGSTTIDQTGHASGDGDSFTATFSLGRDFNKGGWGFGPYLRAMYTKMSFDAMEEHFDEAIPGFGFALALDTRDVTSLTSTLGGKLTYAHSTSWGVLIPHLQVEWQHEYQADPAEVEARFLYDPTGTPFTIHGDPIDEDFFRLGLGMSFIMAKGRSGFFYYEHLIGRERFSQNNLALGIRLEF
jgi:outer membrane autotransporter protein